MIHDRVVERMFRILSGTVVPAYLDASAARLLAEARANFGALRLADRRILRLGEDVFLVATRAGTVRSMTLALALQSVGFTVHAHDGLLEVLAQDGCPDLHDVLSGVSQGRPVDLFAHDPQLIFEKFHPYLNPHLLRLDALSSRLDADSLAPLCAELTGAG